MKFHKKIRQLWHCTCAPQIGSSKHLIVFCLDVNASTVELRFLLYSRHKVQKLHPYAFLPFLKSAKQNYEIGHLVLPTMQEALEEGKHWVIKQINPWTDHRNLAFVQTAKAQLMVS